MTNRIHHLISIVIICALGWAAYAHTLQYTFHFDDYYFITENLKIRDLSDMSAIWHSLGKPVRFVGMLMFALNYHLHQADVFGYHVVNIMIHMINGLLVYWFVLTTLNISQQHRQAAHLLALAVASMFVLHPLNTQAVTYISQRFASLATLFYLLSINCYVAGRRTKSRKGRILFLSSALVGACTGMFTKQIVLTLPFTIALYEYCFLQPSIRWNKKTMLFGGVFLLLLLIIPTFYKWDFNWLFGLEIQSRSHQGDIITSQSYLMTQFRVIPTYIRLMIIPLGQTLDYDFPLSTSLFVWPTSGGLILIAGIIFMAVRHARRYPCIAFGVLWFFLTLSIESSFIPIYQVIFEHRCYLPSVGFLLATGMLFNRLVVNRKKLMLVLIIILCTLGYLTYERNKVWENETTLWQDIKLKAPAKIRPYIHLGVAYIMKGEYEQAIEEFNQGLAISTDEYKLYHNRGIAYEMKGQLKEALSDYNQAIALNEYAGVSYTNRGGVYSQLKRYDLAIKDYNKSISVKPDYATAYLNRGNLLYQAGHYRKAYKDFLKARSLGSVIKQSELDHVQQLINETAK